MCVCVCVCVCVKHSAQCLAHRKDPINVSNCIVTVGDETMYPGAQDTALSGEEASELGCIDGTQESRDW